MNYEKPKVIAEIGCNHKGEFDIAIELSNLAKDCGADGITYGEHREFLEFDVEQHKKLKEHCDKIDLEYSTSVWDVTSAKEMITFKPSLLKVPSACNNNFDMLKVLRDEFDGDVHLSFGMTNRDEEKQIIEFFEETNQAKERLVIYSCTSGYPVPFKDVCLLEISRLIKEYGDRVKHVGFSGHHLGIAIDNAAFTLGANWIERHFTKDRTWKGTDHAASLEPTGMRKLCRDLKATYEALSYKDSEILEIEQVQRDKLKYRKA